MIRTLIVEDEILARLGLHQLVDWNALGFELLEDAKTGKEAIDTIKLQHPQVFCLISTYRRWMGFRYKNTYRSTICAAIQSSLAATMNLQRSRT